MLGIVWNSCQPNRNAGYIERSNNRMHTQTNWSHYIDTYPSGQETAYCVIFRNYYVCEFDDSITVYIFSRSGKSLTGQNCSIQAIGVCVIQFSVEISEWWKDTKPDWRLETRQHPLSFGYYAVAEEVILQTSDCIFRKFLFVKKLLKPGNNFFSAEFRLLALTDGWIEV